MTLVRLLLTTLTASVLLSGVAGAAPEKDSAGKCRDNGKFVAQALCDAAPAAAGRCRDIKTKKFAKCGTPGTEPMPTGSSSAASSAK